MRKIIRRIPERTRGLLITTIFICIPPLYTLSYAVTGKVLLGGKEKNMEHHYKTKMVCSQIINFTLEGNVVSNVSFVGGCNGNLKAISKLVDGMTVEDIEAKLKGNTCGSRPTSCADQLCIAIRQAYDAQQQ